MILQGSWTRDEEGYMEFSTSSIQRLYETITDKYHQVYNHYLEALDDEEEAHYNALAAGYEMVNDYKTIAGQEEFATTYQTPGYVLDIWYETDYFTGKRVYDKGFIQISSKINAED